MKRALGIVAVAVGVVVTGGCAGGGSDAASGNAVPLPESMPLCGDLFQDGRTIELAEFGRACRTDADALTVPRYVSLECADDRTLVWNDLAWGYVGAPMTLFAAEATVRIPTDQAMQCRQGVSSGTVPGEVVDAP